MAKIFAFLTALTFLCYPFKQDTVDVIVTPRAFDRLPSFIVAPLKKEHILAQKDLQYSIVDKKVNESKVIKINFEGVVNEESVTNFITVLAKVQESNPDYIVLEINTPGGSVAYGYIMSKAMEASKTPIACYVDGTGAISMGAFLLQSCDLRAMAKRSQIMIHAPLVFDMPVTGDQSKFLEIYKELHALTESMIYQLTFRTNVSEDECRERIKDGKMWWINWREALERQMIDVAYSSEAELVNKLKKKEIKVKKLYQ